MGQKQRLGLIQLLDLFHLDYLRIKSTPSLLSWSNMEGNPLVELICFNERLLSRWAGNKLLWKPGCGWGGANVDSREVQVSLPLYTLLSALSWSGSWWIPDGVCPGIMWPGTHPPHTHSHLGMILEILESFFVERTTGRTRAWRKLRLDEAQNRTGDCSVR